MQFGNLTLKRCRYGWMLYDVGPIYVGKCLDLYGQYSEGEVALMRTLLREGDTAIDVGANIGALTVPMAGIVGESGRVYAIEFDRDTFNILCANLALNGIRNVRPMNALVAGGDSASVGPIGGGAPNNGAAPNGGTAQSGESDAVSAVALDSLPLEACDFVKIDVDGGELDVLRSGEMQIERYRPFLYFENELRERSSALLAFVIGTLGYDVYFHPTPLFEPDNYFGNPVNHWAPTEFVSMMMLGVPRERHWSPDLKRVAGAEDWWDHAAPVRSYYVK